MNSPVDGSDLSNNGHPIVPLKQSKIDPSTNGILYCLNDASRGSFWQK